MTMVSAEWKPDSELAGFVQRTLTFQPDYDGPVTATLVRHASAVSRPQGAILYLHGFIDYFFHRHVADRFKGELYNFYALDLRKYGRSLDRAKHPNICLTFGEYFEEISAAIEIIRGEGHSAVTLMAHSTGALPAALYAKDGSQRAAITSLMFNSPFLALPHGTIAGWLASVIGAIAPFGATGNRINPWYAKSLHVSQKGTWDFNLTLKPLDGFRAYWGWLRAVVQAQNRIRNGLGLEQPVLVMHSDKSLSGSQWREEFHRADLVIKVNDIKRIAPALGSRVVLEEVRDGKHDLTLSEDTPRERCLQLMLAWVNAHP
jgi:alpha-beta hydrolase superfamily lysophospholipase